MKVILFVPPGGYFAERWAQGSTMPNLGILYIAAVLVQAVEAGGDLSKVAGISYHDKEGNTIHNPTRVYIKDLNDLPYPARHLVPLDKYNFTMDVPGHGPLPAASVITSRGCPFSCTFCATPGNWGRKVRAHTPEYVLDEIQFCMDRYGAKVIWVYDDIFNFNPKRVNEICDLIL